MTETYLWTFTDLAIFFPVIVECSGNPCQNGAKCDFYGKEQYKCRCLPGYTGEHCEIGKFFLNDCSPNNYLGMNLWMYFTLSTVNQAENKYTKKWLLLTMQQIIVNLAGNFVPYETHWQ